MNGGAAGCWGSGLGPMWGRRQGLQGRSRFNSSFRCAVRVEAGSGTQGQPVASARGAVSVPRTERLCPQPPPAPQEMYVWKPNPQYGETMRRGFFEVTGLRCGHGLGASWWDGCPSKRERHSRANGGDRGPGDKVAVCQPGSHRTLSPISDFRPAELWGKRLQLRSRVRGVFRWQTGFANAPAGRSNATRVL